VISTRLPHKSKVSLREAAFQIALERVARLARIREEIFVRAIDAVLSRP
jgi:hypothetical protein